MFYVKPEDVEQLPVVTDPTPFRRGIPTEKGVFSEQIFGPLKDYTCQCGKYWGVTTSNKRCSKCNVPITSSKMRAMQMARIKLVVPICNPLVVLLNKKLRNVLHGNATISLEGDELVYEEATGSMQSHVEIVNIIHQLTGLPLEFMLLQNILVLPPAFRPGNPQWMDQLNQHYITLLHINQELPIVTKDLQRMLYVTIESLFESIIARLSKKQGIMRRQCLGRELDLSGRAVVVPDPTLKVNEVGVPKAMFEEWQIDFDRVIVNRQPTLHRRSMLACKVRKVDGNVIRTSPLVNVGLNLDHDGDSIFSYVNVKYNNRIKTIHISTLHSLTSEDFELD